MRFRWLKEITISILRLPSKWSCPLYSLYPSMSFFTCHFLFIWFINFSWVIMFYHSVLVSQAEAFDRLRESGCGIVGWYHSHPTFAPNPSVRDIETQLEKQVRWGSRDEKVSTLLRGYAINQRKCPHLSGASEICNLYSSFYLCWADCH